MVMCTGPDVPETSSRDSVLFLTGRDPRRDGMGESQEFSGGVPGTSLGTAWR
jgi:hypothetical protein